jgi:hypothetical protein
MMTSASCFGVHASAMVSGRIIDYWFGSNRTDHRANCRKAIASRIRNHSAGFTSAGRRGGNLLCVCQRLARRGPDRAGILCLPVPWIGSNADVVVAA